MWLNLKNFETDKICDAIIKLECLGKHSILSVHPALMAASSIKLHFHHSGHISEVQVITHLYLW